MKGINTYLTFNGNCREATGFYASCLGAELHMMKFSESPMNVPEEAKDRIIHAQLKKGEAVLMASDAMPGMPFQQGSNFSVALGCDNVQECEKVFSALAQKGKVTMPLQETFWALRFGMITDQFGINWMVNLEKAQH